MIVDFLFFMKILNTEKEDYHVHSLNYSDGLSTIDEIARFAGEIGMKKIVICDHSQAALDHNKYMKKSYRGIAARWKNVFNDVEILFGVEADLLNEKGDVCMHIGGVEGDFIILSYHAGVYTGDKTRVTEGFINAMNRYSKQINIIGHVCLDLGEVQAKKVILEANKHKIPLELNAKYFFKYPDIWDVLLKNADRIYVNSDAHTLYELKEFRKKVFDRLKKEGYLKT